MFNKLRTLFLLPFITLSTGAWAKKVPPCEAILKEGTICKIALDQLHPTQFSAGYRMVEHKLKKMEELKLKGPKELDRYLLEKPAPVILGPKNIWYLTDKHHQTMAAGKSGLTEVYAKVSEKWKDFSPTDFWREMQKENYVYLYNEQGQGPLPPSTLPSTLSGLKDDPYRSLAGMVREMGGYDKTSAFFVEFKWANYFRKNIPQIEAGDAGFEKALELALVLCHAQAARELPGYKPL